MPAHRSQEMVRVAYHIQLSIQDLTKSLLPPCPHLFYTNSNLAALMAKENRLTIKVYDLFLYNMNLNENNLN